MRKMNKAMVRFMAIAMVILSVIIIPVAADAEETATIPEEVTYDDTLDIANFWETRTAPTKEGYVFGGWYTKEGTTYTAIKEADIVERGVESFTGAHAKFVPSYVLSVKAQLEKTTEDNDGKDKTSTYLRVISAVDSTDYKNVGFDILFNKRTPFAAEEQEKTVITTVYKNLQNDEGTINATQEFGSPATHFSVLKINEIKSKNYEKVIYVTPYWTTMDGTKVEGLAKYVRVMDGYTSNQYISVPVNLLTGDGVAAGKMQMTYDYKTLQYVGFDSGVLLPEMDVNVDETTGKITFVGNATIGADGTYATVEPESDIYANVWFKEKTAGEIEAGVTVPTFWEFKMSNAIFCNWEEDMIENVEAWDVRY